jgi:hypothetical protein
MSAIAKTDQDRGTRFFILNRNGLEQDAHLLGRQDRRLSFLDTVLGPAHRVRRVERDDLARDEPIEEHPDGGEVLLDSRLGMFRHQKLDGSGDGALEACVAGFVHFAHTSSSDRGQDLVRAEFMPVARGIWLSQFSLSDREAAKSSVTGKPEVNFPIADQD